MTTTGFRKETFGSLLQHYREHTVFKRDGRLLSQQQLANEISRKTGLYHTRNLISNWENDKSYLHSQKDRQILLTVVTILHENGGIASLQEANQLLEAGNYKTLSTNEKEQIFRSAIPDHQTEIVAPDDSKNPQRIIKFLVERVFYSIFTDELKAGLAKAEEGPSPSWPRKVVVLINGVTDGWSRFQTIRALGWVWAWLLSIWLITPSWHWPFADQEQAFLAIAMYIVGILSIPLLIGLLTDTIHNKFWQERPLAANRIVRLYTHQGAGIGFYLGYMAIFMVNLLIYYVGLNINVWMERIEITLLLIISYGCARLVPDNLWRAFKRLDLADGGVFFVFLLLGPLWGVVFYFFYPLFLNPIFGLFVATSITLFEIWQYKRIGTSVIPTHWWTIMFGCIAVLYEMTIAQNLFSVVSLAGVVITLSTLLARKRIHPTFRGMIVFILAGCFITAVLTFNLWAGRILLGISLLLWWRWGQKYLSFPLDFWAIILSLAGCIWMLQQQAWSDIQASIVFSVAILLLLLWERKLALSNQIN